jgi:hypothetical protein
MLNIRKRGTAGFLMVGKTKGKALSFCLGAFPMPVEISNWNNVPL